MIDFERSNAETKCIPRMFWFVRLENYAKFHGFILLNLQLKCKLKLGDFIDCIKSQVMGAEGIGPSTSILSG